MGKTSSSTTNKTIYGNTATTNPYVTSRSSNEGTVTTYNKGSAFDTINTFVNNNMESLLEQYLNPTLNTVSNQAKLNSYINTLNNESKKTLENNIINPLTNRNMLRSSQATNLYNNLASTNANAISNYANELLGNSQKDTASVLNTLLTAYLSGYAALAEAQKQSLSASQGNATRIMDKDGGNSILDNSTLMNYVLLTALQGAGL